MPELQPRGKTDALGHALKKSREELAIDRIRTGPITERQELEDRFIFTFQNGEIKTHLKKEMTPTFIARARGEINKAKPVDITHKQMQKRDPIVYREIKDGIVVNYTKSGQIIEQAVKKSVLSQTGKRRPLRTPNPGRHRPRRRSHHTSRTAAPPSRQTAPAQRTPLTS